MMKKKLVGLKRAQKRFVTLVEMMIVMFLIAMIVGVIAYNYTGSLEEGKAFKTKAGIEKIQTILDLYIASHPDDASDIGSKWKEIVKSSPLVKGADELIKDGWGVPYTVSRNDQDGAIIVHSDKYQKYVDSGKGKSGMFGK